jgi:DNA-binding transcriptional LysR family regulator
MDRLEGMAAFLKVAELGSFSAAARQLGLSKSAVSKHVAALEERLGVRLLNRTTRRLALTEVGLGYRDWCARIVQEVEEAEQEAGRHGAEPRGRLKVSAPMTFGVLHLAPLLPEFLARHSLVEVELALDDRVVDLIEDGFDVAVRIGQPRDSCLTARRLADASHLCAASPAYLATAGMPRHPADLHGHDCLRYTLRRSPDVWEFERGGERQAVRLRGRLCANNGDVLRDAALEGLGVVVLPDFIVGGDIASGRLVRLLADWRLPTIPVQAVWPPQRHPSPKLRAFVDFLAERLAERCPGAARRAENG